MAGAKFLPIPVWMDTRVFVFEADGRLIGASPALLGSARGDASAPGIGTRELSKIRPGADGCGRSLRCSAGPQPWGRRCPVGGLRRRSRASPRACGQQPVSIFPNSAIRAIALGRRSQHDRAAQRLARRSVLRVGKEHVPQRSSKRGLARALHRASLRRSDKRADGV